MKPKLIISTENEADREFLIEENRDYIVGRDMHADICLPERRISRKHAIIRWDSDSQHLELEDLGSLNGSYINDQPIKKPSRLHHGDQIRIGGFFILIDFPQNHISGIEMSSVLDLEPLRTHPDSSPQSEAEEVFNRLSSSEPKEETGGRLISGRLQELALPDVLQMLATTRKSGVLAVSSHKLLRLPKEHETQDADLIFIREGNVLDAQASGLEAEAAFYKSLEREEGYFALFPLSGLSNIVEKIEAPLEMLLLEGMRRLDEKKAGGGELSANDELEPKLDEPLTNLSPEELKIFQLAWKYRKISEIIAHSSDSPIEVETHIKKLIRNGFLKKI